MYNNARRRLPEDIQTEMTVIWCCSDDECKGWMRENFTFSHDPACPICGSSMKKTERMLEVVANVSPLQTLR